MTGTVVFLGPSLPRDEARALLPDALLLPPAGQGDVFRAVRAHALSAVGLVDGAFLEGPAVWHREILWALERGVGVFGAASMGALRAAELHLFGMVGVGQVFAAYRDGALPGWDPPFEDDDEVAVVHGPAELGCRPLSDAMVDLRATLLRAEQAGVVHRAERDRLAGLMKALHFPDRSHARLAAAADPGLRAWIEANAASLKADDARALLRALRTPHPPPAPPGMERALAWERFVARSEAEDGPGAAVLRILRRDEADWRAVAREALGRAAMLRDEPLSSAAERRGALDRLRRSRALLMRADLDRWLADNHLDATTLTALLDREARLDRAVDQADQTDGSALEEAMLDVLRLSGRYRRLRDEA